VKQPLKGKRASELNYCEVMTWNEACHAEEHVRV